jgi:hypothetical protein
MIACSPDSFRASISGTFPIRTSGLCISNVRHCGVYKAQSATLEFQLLTMIQILSTSSFLFTTINFTGWSQGQLCSIHP